MSHVLANGWLQAAVYFVVLFACVKPLGLYMARVYEGERVFLSPVLGWLERGFYRLAKIDAAQDMGWKVYAANLLIFSAASGVALYALLRAQGFLPFNPTGADAVSPDLAFNIAVSFITNTDWQSYSGESALSTLSQMAGLTVQNFLSASVGMAAMVAMVRGFVRKNSGGLGNFWSDVTRGVLYILLPLSLIFAVVLGAQGVVQTFASSVQVEGIAPQTIAVGPVASQIAIKQLGTNGGGFFNANAAHPFENPTALSNFLAMLAILLLPAALCYTFGRMIRDTRQGWALLIAMTLIFVPLFLFSVVQEQGGNPRLAKLGTLDQKASVEQTGGNMEGKETRFGIVNSVLWATTTTAASNGSVNAMHDSFTPLGGLVPLFLMQFGEVIYGGVGSGLYGMLVFVLVTVFIAGLMVGRTPEYLGKKVQAFEMKMASLALLIPPMVVLLGTALGVVTVAGTAALGNSGAQGFSEILYAFTSAGNNNGSAFAGLSANTPFYNIVLGVVMLVGRFGVLLPCLAIAGSLAAKNTVPPSNGTLATHTPLFVFFLIGVVVMVGVLTYVPALALGPIAEHYAMLDAVK